MGEAKRRGTFEQRLKALWDEFGVRPMTTERYNAFVAWTRLPTASFIGTELEFFSTEHENLIGVIIMDNTDRDFGFVTLGRDEKGRYRAIDGLHSLTRTDARHQLFANLKSHTESGETVFPQGDADADNAGIDLFTPVAAEAKLHPHFKLLKDGDQWIPARAVMTEMMRHFVDSDGNFVEQFQTTAFDSRIWELYLYASLLEMGLYVERPDPAPDFQVSIGRQKVFIEAVTVGPTANSASPEAKDAPLLRTPDEIKELLKGKMPIKFGSALYSKLNRKSPYWEIESVKGRPLVLAVADFHEPQSMTWTSPALMQYLYGVSHDFSRGTDGELIISALKVETFVFEGKQIPAGFFLLPKAENVSAVLFTASGTLSKFSRMGRLAGFGLTEHQVLRMGVRHKHDPSSALPEPFFHEVTQGLVTETWAEGLSMFHNPKALHPVEPDMFPGIAHHWFEDGKILSVIPKMHPYSSFTWHLLPKNEHDAPLAEVQ
nr:hypothetical protein [uncultured Albidiferax sp.]